LVTTHISSSKKEAACTVCLRVNDVKIFTDGSGLNEHVGAAALASNGQCHLTLTFTLGTLTEHSVLRQAGRYPAGSSPSMQLPILYGHALITLNNQPLISALPTMPPAWMLGVSALHYSTGSQEGFRTLASACALHLTTF